MRAGLMVRTGLRDGRTELLDSAFTAPYKIAKPFYDGDTMRLMVMGATPGLLDGDALSWRVEAGAGSRVEMTGQSYTKVFRSGGTGATQQIRLKVGAGARLFYLPQPVIPFAGSVFRSTCQADLAPDAAFVYLDAVSAGRTGMGERFQMERFCTRTEVRVAGRPVFLDNAWLWPGRFPVAGMGFCEGHSHQGMLYVRVPGADIPGAARAASEQAAGAVEMGVSAAVDGYAVRLLADSGQAIERFCRALLEWLAA